MRRILTLPRLGADARLALWCWMGLLAALVPCACGTPVKLRAVESTAAAAAGHPLDSAVDGSLAADNGWSIKDGQFEQQFAVFATEKPVAATTYRIQFFFLDTNVAAHFVNFGVSVTTDENPGLQSHWSPLLPETASANFSNCVKITGRMVRITSEHPGMVVTLHVRAPFLGITGFRLRLRPFNNDTAPQGSLGGAPDGNFLLTEFEVEAEPMRTSNIALGCEVYSSGVVPADLPKRNLTDGLVNTYSQPDPSLNGKSFYFTLDLGRTVALDHLVVRGRRDGGESNRLAAYRVELLADVGELRRKQQWQAFMRQDGFTPPPDEADVIHARDGKGTFSGEVLRIYNQPGENLQPQIAELEVYPSLNPQTQSWLADDVALKQGGEIVVPAGARKLSFTITSREQGVFPDLLIYRWRVPGWSEQWRETAPGGRVELTPPPPPGTFDLHVQAQHTDGVWDESGQRVIFRITRHWWNDPALLGLVIGGVVISAAGICWWLYGLRMNHRLAVAEQHLELHRERLRIARDMHDEMGARLTYIALLADRTRREASGSEDQTGNPLERLSESARSAVNALDNIVWAVNPQHDTVGSLADYICDYAPEYLQAAEIECRLDIQVRHPQGPLSLTVRHGLLMAIKEAIQNVAKHANASNVRLTFHEGRGRIMVSVTDNGRGFLAGKNGSDRSGLANMRLRLAEIGGSCEIEPGPEGHGTCIRFTLPLEQHH